ncbi:TPA: hypothetical protein RHK09_002835 [Enterococcus faecalis]|nr:hypothetical protein [Enterococcus faecalis]HDT7978322.1 hypothetical protein [Enterococcus faecalis]HDT7981242.1 hypothetical protein [Enterococcus faecalis]HDT7989863.1 hypothetical protein [Enterococcus faecalis]HDT8039410.1 hypothetical protein [Enterococcus faecalis]
MLKSKLTKVVLTLTLGVSFLGISGYTAEAARSVTTVHSSHSCSPTGPYPLKNTYQQLLKRNGKIIGTQYKQTCNADRGRCRYRATLEVYN